MKILTLNYEFPPVGGGAAPVSFDLARALAGLGHSVDVVTMRWKNLPAVEMIDGIRIYRTPALRARPDVCRTHELATYLLGAAGKTLRLARQNRYDIIHAHFIIPTSPLAVWIKKISRIPFVITCHGSDVPGHNPARFTRAHRLLHPAWRYCIRQADGVICPSSTLGALVSRNEPCIQPAIIPNGIDVDFFQTAAQAPKTKTILYCGRLLAFKGVGHLIESVHKLNLGWQVHILGDGPYRQELEKQAAGSATPIHFHGWLNRHDPRFMRLFAESSIFVFPSEAENFPTVLLEAMSAGLAVLSSDAGGCPEAVGDAAILYPAGDVQKLQANLLRLMEDEPLRRQMGKAAVQQARQFSWPAIAKRYLEFFEKSINKR